MRIVAALGGNALLRRGEPATEAAQRRNARLAAEALAPLARAHGLVVTHGNGPQVGLLALREDAAKPDEAFPLDILGAESVGMIGYTVERELASLLPPDTAIATILTMVEVDAADPALGAPTKFIGPAYDDANAARLAAEKRWALRKDGGAWRRVVPSPRPIRILELRPVQWLLEHGTVVICAGGGGVPTIRGGDGALRGIEAVIDKDLASELLARELAADLLVLATDVDAVYAGWGSDSARAIRSASPEAMREWDFPEGSMGPKVEAACRFAERTGQRAAISALEDLAALVAGEAGTTVDADVAGVHWHPPPKAGGTAPRLNSSSSRERRHRSSRAHSRGARGRSYDIRRR